MFLKNHLKWVGKKITNKGKRIKWPELETQWASQIVD